MYQKWKHKINNLHLCLNSSDNLIVKIVKFLVKSLSNFKLETSLGQVIALEFQLSVEFLDCFVNRSQFYPTESGL